MELSNCYDDSRLLKRVQKCTLPLVKKLNHLECWMLLKMPDAFISCAFEKMVAGTSVLESIESLFRNLHSPQQRKSAQISGILTIRGCKCGRRTRPERNTNSIFPEASMQLRQASSPATSIAPLGYRLGAILHVQF